MAKIGDFDIRFQGADARFRFQAGNYPTFHPVWKAVPCRGVKFQVGNYPTFLPTWKAVLSVAMVAWDAVSGP